MKTALFISCLFITTLAIGQKTVAPPAAKTAFGKAFPNATKTVWEKEDGNFEVTFENGGQKMSAIYDSKGNLKESETAIQVSALPATVTVYMNRHYKGITIKGAAKITKPDGTINYEAELKGKDVLFDATGKFIKEAKD